ncbi:MAG TPA: poly-gamma-glutamate system protein, partial [Armatimonadota bacterium]
MKYMVGSERILALVVLAVISVGLCGVASTGGRQVKQPLQTEKLVASRKLQAAQEVVRKERIARGLPINEDDRLNTGWIGLPTSGLTTDKGFLQAKRSTTNPNLGAAMVQMLADAGVKRGDAVAIGMSGSFPALNTAAIVATETLGAYPITISSVGASQWGANEAGWTWLQIEDALARAGIISHRSVAISRGGSLRDDPTTVSNLDKVLLENRSILRGNHIHVINDGNIRHSIERRVMLYGEAAKGRRIAVFVNVGGNIANVGSKHTNNLFATSAQGTMGIMAGKGVKTIDTRHIKNLCVAYGLPWDPTTMPLVGEGDLYYKSESSPELAGGCLV